MSVVYGFIKKEIIQLLRNPALLFALLITPLIQTAILNNSLSNTAQNIRMYMDAEPNDYVMAKVREKAASSKWFSEVEPTAQDAFEVLRGGKADMVLVAPPKTFTRALGNGEPEMQILIDASNVVRAQAVQQYAQAIVARAVAESRLVMPQGISGVDFKTRILFNPELDTNFFCLPFVVAMLAGSSVLVLICDSMSREKEQGTFETLISAPIEKYHIILGKTIPFILVTVVNMISLLIESMLMFHLPFVGSVFQMIVIYLVFAVAMSAAAILVSTYCATQKQGMLATMMLLIVLMMLSGGMSPVDNMPPWLKTLANANPMYHFSELFRTLLLKGCEWGYLFDHLLPIVIFGLVCAFFAKLRFKTTL